MRGSVYQKGGTWYVRVYLGPDPTTGKRRYKAYKAGKTKKEAEALLAKLIAEIEQGTYVAPSKATLAEWLRRWLDMAKPQLAVRTWERYRELCEHHIIPALGATRLHKLAPLHLQTFLNRLLESGRKDGKGGLSPQTVHHIHRLLHRAFEVAVKLQVLARNPCDAVEPPKVPRREMKALDEAGARALLEAAAGTRLYPIVYLALATGLRRSELCGLRWQDVDLENCVLYVRRTLHPTKSQGLVEKAPKTHRSARSVPFPADVAQVLREWRKQQLEERLRLGAAYRVTDYVFTEEEGGPVHPDRLTQRFEALVQKAGLPRIRLHDLRHSTATLLIRAGETLKTVQEVLGHSSIRTTGDIYAHVLPDHLRAAAEKLGALLAPGAKKKGQA